MQRKQIWWRLPMNVVDKLEDRKEALSPAPTLGSLSQSQIDAIREIPAHDEAEIRAIEASRPSSIFVDKERYDQEIENVFRRRPVPVTLTAMMPEPASVMAHDGYGLPILLMRDKNGQMRAFLNACQHKGAKLVEGGCDPQKTGKVVCPYHAWAFGLDGSLIGVPREETYENLDKAKRNLVSLPCMEAGGIVWVILDKDAEPDFSGVHPQIVEDLRSMAFDQLHLYGHKTFDLKANWKLVLEPFLEGYHVQRLHANSIGNMFADVPNVTDVFGDHIRQISGKINFKPEDLDKPGENIHKTVTHAYEIFPNGVLVTSPYYISFMIIMPRAAGESVVEYFFLVRGEATTEKVRELYAKSYDLILKVFGTEDFVAAELCQEGLESGALNEVVYCGLEETIPVYYKNLERYL